MKHKFILLLILFIALLFPKFAYAATFSLNPGQGSLTIQTTTPVDIKLNNTDSTNVISAVISYPVDLLDITWIKTDASAFGVEVEQSVNNGEIRISRGALSPVSGSNIELATIGITPKAAGNAALNFTDSSAVISSTDTSNILNLASSTGANFTIIAPQISNPAPSATTNPTTTTTSNTPAPAPANMDTTCQQAVDALKSKLVGKYKSISKVFVRLDTISTLTANYYQTQFITKGQAMAGYPLFNNQITAARQTALTRLSSLQSIANNLNCQNARNQVVNFKNETMALKKELISFSQANTNLLTRLKGQ